MRHFGRRPFLRSGLAAAAGVPALSAHCRTAVAARYPASNANAEIAAQVRRERAETFFRAYYAAYDTADAPGFLSNFVQSDQTRFEDATGNLVVPGYQAIAGLFSQLLPAEAAVVGTGRLFKLFHVTGDLNYGAVVEYVNLRNTFFSTNGLSVQAVFDLDNGHVARETDYSDTRELGVSDIVGPADLSGVAFPSAPIHPGGVPRSSTTPAPRGAVALATGVTGKPSASPEIVEFVQQFQGALRSRSVAAILSFFTEDAVYVNPLIHQGPPLYGNFDQTIQIEGRDLIAGLFASTINTLPDCRGSSLVHVVGGSSGGGSSGRPAASMPAPGSTATACPAPPDLTCSTGRYAGCRSSSTPSSFRSAHTTRSGRRWRRQASWTLRQKLSLQVKHLKDGFPKASGL